MSDQSPIFIPADVPQTMQEEFRKNVMTATHESGRLFLFAGDQKVEHLNNDFYGEGIPAESANPEHLFQIASQSPIGVFASQLGLIARYGKDYANVPYMIKLNSKTNLVKTDQAESISRQWIDVEQVVEMKRNSGLNIVGVGYTVYVGSEYESIMYHQAAQAIYKAHQHGLFATLWMYPRGKAVPHEKTPHIIAGAAGVGACLGADFVKVNYPDSENPAEDLKEAVAAAGRTKLICAGGSTLGPEEYLRMLHDQITISGAQGTALGRNIHQRPLNEAVKLSKAVKAVIVDNVSYEEAVEIYKNG